MILRPGHREASSTVIRPGHREPSEGAGSDGNGRARPSVLPLGDPPLGSVPRVSSSRRPRSGRRPPHRPPPRATTAIPFDDSVQGQLIGDDHDSIRAAQQAAVAASGDPEGFLLLGVNAPGVRVYEGNAHYTRYGCQEAILSDLEAPLASSSPPAPGATTASGLGGHFFRSPIGVDLSKAILVPVAVDGPVEVPVSIDPTTGLPVTASYPRNTVYSRLKDALWDDLVALFSGVGPAPDRHPLQVLFTTLSIGATVPESVDPIGEYLSEHMLPLQWEGTHFDSLRKSPSGTGRLAIRLLWEDGTTYVTIDDFCYSPTHPGATSIYSVAAALPTPPDEASVREFVFGTLDPRSRYALRYLYIIGYWTAYLLCDLRLYLLAAGGPDIARDHILGLQIGNELNQANILPLPEDTADLSRATTLESQAALWARAVHQNARGLQRGFYDAYVERPMSPSFPDRIFWLPALAMYQELDSATMSRQQRFADLYLWEGFLVQWMERVNEDPEFTPPSEKLDHTSFAVQDYHYYHYTESQTVGHIVKLLAQLQALQDARDAYGEDLGHAVIGACELGVPSDLSELETGGSVASIQFPYLADAVSEAAPLGLVERFQAQQVWQRIATGSTLGKAVAWHTHLGPPAGGFQATGIRSDPSDSVDPSVDMIPASAARAKASWFAYQRLARLLAVRVSPDTTYDATTGAAEVQDFGPALVAGRLVYAPPAGSASTAAAANTFYEGLDATSGAAMAMVIEFTPGTVADYVYVVFLDPIAAAATEADFEVTPTSARSTVYHVPSVPDPTAFGTTSAATAVDYPVDEAGSDWRVVSDSWTDEAVFHLTLKAEDDPVILLSTCRLNFTVEDA